MATVADDSVLDTSDFGLVLIARDASVLYVNRVARTIIESEPHLFRVERRRSRQSRSPIASIVERFMDGCAVEAITLHLTRPHKLPLLVRVAMDRLAELRGAPDEPVLALRVVDPDRPPSVDRRALREIYDLTPAESEVAVRIALGHSISAIARELGHREGTTRPLLKRVYGKTGTHRQHQLAVVILRIASGY